MDYQLMSMMLQQLTNLGLTVCNITKVNDNGSVDVEERGSPVMEDADNGGTRQANKLVASNIYLMQFSAIAGGIVIKPSVGDACIMLGSVQSMDSALLDGQPGPLGATNNGMALLVKLPNTSGYSVPTGVDTHVRGNSIVLGDNNSSDLVSLGTPANGNFTKLETWATDVTNRVNALSTALSLTPPVTPLVELVDTKATNVKAS